MYLLNKGQDMVLDCYFSLGSTRWCGFSSSELKAQVIFSDRLSSVVCLSVRLCVSLQTCPIFEFFSRTTGPILTKLGIKLPWVKGIQVCSNEGPLPFLRRDNCKKVILHSQLLKIFFSRTTGSISNKIATKHL